MPAHPPHHAAGTKKLDPRIFQRQKKNSFFIAMKSRENRANEVRFFIRGLEKTSTF
jgi:hypothetical protein